MTNVAVVLAAGQGQRMKSHLPKVMIPLLGKPMLGHILEQLSKVFDHIVVVSNPGHHQTHDFLKTQGNVSIVFQDKPLGTAHAALAAIKTIEGDSTVLITNADMPLIQEIHLRKYMDEFIPKTLCILSTQKREPFGYGRIILNGEKFVKIVEEKDASLEEKKIKTIYSGLMISESSLFKKYLPLISNTNVAQEYYLTSLPEVMLSYGEDIQVIFEQEDFILEGVNDPEELNEIEKILRQKGF